MSPELLYLSFDIVPAPKGAAVHIEQFARAIAGRFTSLQLITINKPPSLLDWRNPEYRFDSSDSQVKEIDFAPGIRQIELPACGETLIDRVLHFRKFLKKFLDDKFFDIVHFRSPFEGYLIAQEKKRFCRSLIFEVNGLPSIELKYRYPDLAEDTVLLEKIIAQENTCIEAADLLITPSSVTRNYLASRAFCKDKTRLIPNAVDLSVFKYKPPARLRSSKETLELIYIGTLSAWQGVELALTAAALINERVKTKLTIIGAGKAEQKQKLLDLAYKLGVSGNLKFMEPCAQEELLLHLHEADLILAPLSPNDRNLLQGCCPFKIIEGMASGTVVLASDLPVVREIAGESQSLLLCKAGSAGAIKDAVFSLLDAPEKFFEISKNARARIEANYNLERSKASLCDLYEDLLKSSCMSSSS